MNENISWTNRDVLAATQGQFLFGGREETFSGIAIDSRTIQPGQLFVAIRGRSHDGHLFIEKAVKSGARGLLVERDFAEEARDFLERIDASCIAVDDTVRALGRLGRYRRRLMGLPVVAITGTNGKTTTKEMVAGVLAGKYRALATAGNYNNEIGVPLTLLRLEKKHQVAVLELGMNAPGEIDRLARICEPDVGLVLNVGAGHLAGLGDIDGVAAAKSELVTALGEKAVALLNADDPRVLAMAQKTAARVVTWGTGADADIRAVRVKKTARGTNLDIAFFGEQPTLNVQICCRGSHLVANALAAAAVGHVLDVPAAAVKAGLETFVPVAGRLVTTETAAGFVIMDDTYNANPGSSVVAIDELAEAAVPGRRIMVFGDMYELGRGAREMHRQIGRRAAERGVDKIFAVGEFAGAVAEGALAGGMPPADIFLGDKAEINGRLLDMVGAGDRVLVKGSRGMAMETIVAALMRQGQQAVTTEKG
ncbi:MAG: UDP-N-acetylmuramoyl-tripeptide--D-alanyl-D-alanine ligase [Desulfosudaceae bacterium]